MCRGGGYASLKSRVWDNLFALSILGEQTALRTEEVRMLRLLGIVEKLATGDAVLNTGVGIFSLYMATVLLPGDVFPLADLALPTEPTTQPVVTDVELETAIARLGELQFAWREINTAYEQQVLEYRSLQFEIVTEDPAQPAPEPIVKHDPLALAEARVYNLDTRTLEVINGYGATQEFSYMPDIQEKLLAEMREVGRIVHGRKDNYSVVRLNSSLIQLSNECADLPPVSPCSPFNAGNLVQWPGGAGHVRPLGIGDLKVVKSQLLKYELGEVAHVENMLKGEKKVRTFRNLDRNETSTTTDNETTRETLKETQTTERFELQQEASNITQQDQESSLGVTAAYGFPAGSIGLNANISSSTSELEATSQATTYAKDVMERALSRVIERTRTTRTVTTIVEHEDTAEHSFDNTTAGGGGTDNIAGVYRWLDKLYYNKVVNYGKRLLFEFVVPEPAAFYLFSKLAKPAGNDVMQMPPPFDLVSFGDVRIDNYDTLAVRYGAVGVKPPPVTMVTISKTRGVQPDGTNDFNTWSDVLTIPSGYRSMHARVSIILSVGNANYVTVCIDTQAPLTRYVNSVETIPIGQHTGEIPVTLRALSNHYAVAIEVFCSPTAETFQQWQIDTYAALKTAYDQKVSEYNRWVREQSIISSRPGGNNPLLNRQVERNELKKHCIEFITGQRFESFDAMRTNTLSGYPEFSFAEATTEGKYIQFFEQAFEWEQMSYYFYPYFWARKREWVNILKRDENDPLFMNFLQAGAARVLVPVLPSYTKAILHYLSTAGEIWNGEDVPMPDDPMYVSIVDEIKEADGLFEGGEIVGEPWISKVPTNLVYLTSLTPSPNLPDYSADLLPPA